MAHTVDFTVVGEERIHCEACERRIGNALRRLPGVRDVRASAQTQQVVVVLDLAEVSPDQVQGRLQRLGYEVERQESEP